VAAEPQPAMTAVTGVDLHQRVLAWFENFLYNKDVVIVHTPHKIAWRPHPLPYRDNCVLVQELPLPPDFERAWGAGTRSVHGWRFGDIQIEHGVWYLGVLLRFHSGTCRVTVTFRDPLRRQLLRTRLVDYGGVRHKYLDQSLDMVAIHAIQRIFSRFKAWTDPAEED